MSGLPIEPRVAQPSEKLAAKNRSIARILEIAADANRAGTLREVRAIEPSPSNTARILRVLYGQ